MIISIRYHEDGWYFWVRPEELGWIAFAKREPFRKGGRFDEPGVKFVQVRKTADEATKRIFAEVGCIL